MADTAQQNAQAQAQAQAQSGSWTAFLKVCRRQIEPPRRQDNVHGQQGI